MNYSRFDGEELALFVMELCLRFAAGCLQKATSLLMSYGDYAHAIIDRRDREVGIGGAGEIIKRAQSVTHRLLSANTEEDQTSARSETQREHSHTLQHTFRCGIETGNSMSPKLE